MRTSRNAPRPPVFRDLRAVVVITLMSAALVAYIASWTTTKVLPWWSAHRVLLCQLGPHGLLQFTHLTPFVTGPTDNLQIRYGTATSLLIDVADGGSGAISWTLHSDDVPKSRVLPWFERGPGGASVGINNTLVRQTQTVVSVPLHLPVVLVLLFGGIYLHRKSIASKRNPDGCPACGYDLRATPTRCPECGHEPFPTTDK